MATIVDIYLRTVPQSGPIPNDVWLFGPGVDYVARRRGRPPDRLPIKVGPPRLCEIHPPGLCVRVVNADGSWYCRPRKPEARSLYRDLLERYGPIEGPKTYLAMRHNRQGPFAEGAKYDAERADQRRVLRTTAVRRGNSTRAANGGKRWLDPLRYRGPDA